MKRRLKGQWFSDLLSLIDYVNEKDISQEDITLITKEDNKWYLVFWHFGVN